MIGLKGQVASRFEKVEGTLVPLEVLKEGVAPGKDTDCIIIAENFYPADTPYMLRAKGIISLFGGILSHASLIAREFNIPTIVGVYDLSETEEVNRLLDLLKSGHRPAVKMYGDGRIAVEIK